MKKPQKTKVEKDEIELDADAWPKFEALVKSAAKMGPKPHANQVAASGRKNKD